MFVYRLMRSSTGTPSGSTTVQYWFWLGWLRSTPNLFVVPSVRMVREKHTAVLRVQFYLSSYYSTYSSTSYEYKHSVWVPAVGMCWQSPDWHSVCTRKSTGIDPALPDDVRIGTRFSTTIVLRVQLYCRGLQSWIVMYCSTWLLGYLYCTLYQ